MKDNWGLGEIWAEKPGGDRSLTQLGLLSRPRPPVPPLVAGAGDYAQNPQGRDMGRSVRAQPQPPVGTLLSPEITVSLVLVSCTCPPSTQETTFQESQQVHQQTVGTDKFSEVSEYRIKSHEVHSSLAHGASILPARFPQGWRAVTSRPPGLEHRLCTVQAQQLLE